MADDTFDGGEPLPPRDNAGCMIAVVRGCFGMALLQILMALAIIAAALISLLFFR
ncbi:MAG: hypothetical protein WEF86_05765 [Gemmatimonadota bacterium]